MSIFEASDPEPDLVPNFRLRIRIRTTKHYYFLMITRA
jgi:hypothetical protein